MAKRWTIPFVSRQSKQCRIDIYDPSWSGAVTELSTNNANAPGVAAEDPFYFEEDDDENLLSVIRVKTGYINLIETTFGGLDDLHPTLMKNRYVEVYYDSTLVFRGYIQQQTFENDWAAAPREVSLPVISPLGLAESLTFEAEMPLTDNKIGYYMKQIIGLLDSSQGTKYDRVTFPQVDNCPEFYGTIRPTITTSEKSSFSQALNATSFPYEGNSLYDFLEGICNAYGWICHDLPDQILFTRFDHTGNYAYYSVNDLAAATNRQTVSVSDPMTLNTYMEPCSDDASISLILPLRKLTAKSMGEVISSVKAEYKHMRCSKIYTYNHNGEEEYLVFLKNIVIGAAVDISGTYLLDSNTVTESENKLYLQDNGINVIDMNGKMMLVMKNLGTWSSSGDTLATLYFYERPVVGVDAERRDMKLKVELTTGDSLNNLGTYDIICTLAYELWCGNTLIGSQNVSYINDNYSVELSFDNVPNNNALRLVIKNVSAGTMWPLLSFDKIELYYKEESYAKYSFRSRVIDFVGDVGYSDEAEIDMLMQCLWIDSNQIGTTIISGASSTYRYLRSTQDRLQIRMQPKSGQSLPMLTAYISRIQYWKSAWRWRLIAMSFNPWNDEYTLTLHHSTTIDS